MILWNIMLSACSYFELCKFWIIKLLLYDVNLMKCFTNEMPCYSNDKLYFDLTKNLWKLIKTWNVQNPLMIYRIITTNLTSFWDNTWLYANVFQKRETNGIICHENASVYFSRTQFSCIFISYGNSRILKKKRYLKFPAVYISMGEKWGPKWLHKISNSTK